jgi:FMN-dependent NADH-azoreductase
LSTLLHVSASPRGAASDSRIRAGAFLDSHRQAHPDVTVEDLNLLDATLPAFGGIAA